MNKAVSVTISAVCLVLAAAVLVVGVWTFFDQSTPRLHPVSLENSITAREESEGQSIVQDFDPISLQGPSLSAAAVNEAAAPAVQTPSVQTPSAQQSGEVYQTEYNMKVRNAPDYEAEQLGRRAKGQSVRIVQTQSGSNSSIWGQLADGGWICLQDADLVYCSRQ